MCISATSILFLIHNAANTCIYLLYALFLLHYTCKYTVMEKIIHVHLIFEKKDYYFGSIAAIYTVLEPEQIGVKYNTLRNAKWKDISVYQTQRAIIKQGEIVRSKQL